MTLRPLSRDEVRELDRRAIEQYGVPGIVLMENAGRAAAQWLAELGGGRRVVICCGKGNNGGDGYVIARHLDAWGYDVRVVLACEPSDITGDALTNLRTLGASNVPIDSWQLGSRGAGRVEQQLRQADRIVDGLLGTGARGALREPIRSAIEFLNSCTAAKFAIDIPSGLDADTGRPLGAAVRASHTATFVAPKRGFLNPDSAAFTGELRVFDIGIPRRLLHEFDPAYPIS